jgi:hypothetical protein
MLGIFVEKLSSFVDRRFTVAYWAPALIGAGAAVGLTAVLQWPAAGLGWWARRDATEQIVLGAAGLCGVTVLAYLLSALSFPLARLYEGFWPERMRNLWAALGLQDAVNARIDRQSHTRPRQQALVRPTRLGNVLAAAEEHAYQLYRLDTVIWWPRLVTLLPEGFRQQLDAALTPMLALLNICTMLGVVALVGGAAVLVVDHRWWLFVAVFGGGLTLARVCYLAAINQAQDYGTLVGVAFDLHRHAILQQMRIPVPEDLVRERLMWESLNPWIEGDTMPWETAVAVPQLARPFHYEPYSPPPKPPMPQEIVVTVQRAPPAPSSAPNAKADRAPAAPADDDPRSAAQGGRS